MGDNSIAASAFLGSTFFITTVVITLVTRASVPDQKVKVTPLLFIRDLIAMFLVYFYLFIHLVIVGYINVWSAIGFFILYIAYVATVVITNRMVGAASDEDEQAGEGKQVGIVVQDVDGD